MNRIVPAAVTSRKGIREDSVVLPMDVENVTSRPALTVSPSTPLPVAAMPLIVAAVPLEVNRMSLVAPVATSEVLPLMRRPWPAGEVAA